MSSENGSAVPVRFLGRDDILHAVDTEYADVFVDVKGWQGTVRVRSISAAERERLMKGSMVIEGVGKHAVQRFDMPTFRIKLAALAMVDLEGNRLFSEADAALLGRRNARAMEIIADAAMELANVQDDTKKDEDGAEDEDEDDPGKGFVKTRPSASRSSSASRSAG